VKGPPRKFDHDEARKLRAEGWTYRQLAAKYSVTPGAIRFACDDAARAKSAAYGAEWQRQGTCPDCGAAATRHSLTWQLRCMDCAARARTKAQDGEAYCSCCDTWKPLDEFTPSSKRKARGVRNECRACETARRRKYREQRKVPCTRCGKPRLPANEIASREARKHLRDTGLCRPCYLDSVRKRGPLGVAA
jgi:hypothetical protein